MRRRHSHRSQSSIDIRPSILAPPKQTREEAPQRDQLLTFGNQDDATDRELGAGLECTLLAICTVDQDAVLAAEIMRALFVREKGSEKTKTEPTDTDKAKKKHANGSTSNGANGANGAKPEQSTDHEARP
jgi:hypothetical protein